MCRSRCSGHCAASIGIRSHSVRNRGAAPTGVVALPTEILRSLARPQIISRLKFHLLMKTTLAHQLADYACALRFEDLSKDVVHEVKRRVIDSLGCALGAWKEEPFVIARKVAGDFSAKHGSTIFGTDHKAPADWAAFANGCGIRYSISTTRICRKSLRIPATTSQPCSPSGKAWGLVDAK